jgi:hypothetical protein
MGAAATAETGTTLKETSDTQTPAPQQRKNKSHNQSQEPHCYLHF